MILSAILITIIWAVLYLPNLRTSPGWYGDETLIHHTSRNLANGIPSNFALWNTFWHPHYPYQPPYSYVNGLFAVIAKGDILGSRFFNTLLALFAALSILFLGRGLFGYKAAFFSAVMFLCYEQTIIHFRMSYAHNCTGLGLLLMTLFLARRPTPWNDWRAGIGLLIAAGSHPLFVNGAAAAFVCRIFRPRSWIRIYLFAFIYLLLSFTILYLYFGNWLLDDFIHLGETFSDRGNTDGQALKGLLNFFRFILQDKYHLIMVIGLLLFFCIRKPVPAIVGILVLFLLVKNRQNLIVFYYQAVVILPVLALGWGGIWRFFEVILKRRHKRLYPAINLLAFIPVAIFIAEVPDSLKGTLIPRNAFWVTQSPKEVEEASRWLNNHTTKGDFVAANPNIAWLLEAQTAPYLQIITWYGYPTQGYENLNKRERFRYNSSLENARYAVIGDIDIRWSFGEPNVDKLAQKFLEEKWPVVWQGEHYSILKNPIMH